MTRTRITPELHNYLLTFPDGTKWRTGYVYGEEGWALAQYRARRVRVESEGEMEDAAEQVDDNDDMDQ